MSLLWILYGYIANDTLEINRLKYYIDSYILSGRWQDNHEWSNHFKLF